MLSDTQMPYKPLRMVYDKVALGRGNNPASNFKSGIISQITKPSETTSTDKVVNLVLLHPFLGSRGQWRPFLRSLHSALEAQGITAQAFIVSQYTKHIILQPMFYVMLILYLSSARHASARPDP
jgi:hypothetical protein